MNGIDITEGYGPSVRAARMLWLLVDSGDRGLTTAELAEATGMTQNGARRMVNRLAVTVPLYQDGLHWRLLGQE